MNEGQIYARRWIEAWNSGQLAQALALWSDDLTFESPLAAELTGSPVIRGKAAVADYWGAALAQATSLHFELLHAYWDSEQRVVTIVYRRQRGDDLRTAAEIVRLDHAGLGSHGLALHGAAIDPGSSQPADL